jgi:hypothetical protein
MTIAKDLKRLVRARMKKTGESYTAARFQLLKKKQVSERPAKAGRYEKIAAAGRYAELAGMSDASVKEATGCTWERWVRTLDRAGAAEKSHREIAKLVAFFGTPSWWTQMVTVGYERIRGLRERGQLRSGGFQTSKSRTFDADVARVYDAFADARTRKQWLDEDVTVRSATAHKRIRLTWPDGTSVVVGFVKKGAAKSVAAVQHEKLADRGAVDAAKLAWGERFDRLASVVSPRPLPTAMRQRR